MEYKLYTLTNVDIKFKGYEERKKKKMNEKLWYWTLASFTRKPESVSGLNKKG